MEYVNFQWNIIAICLIQPFMNVAIDASCVWPSDFVNSTWVDSLKGDLVFDTTDMSGWSFTVQIQNTASQQTLNQWECITHDETGSYLIMRTKQTFLQFIVLVFYGYRCLKLEKITDASYRYYQMDPVQNELNYERLTALEDGTLTDPSILCENPGVTPATGSEFQIMIKKGYESIAMVTCPYSLLADYTFMYVMMPDAAMSCDQNSDVGTIDMCSDVTMLSVQSPTCSLYPFYSDADSVMCVDVVTVGSDTFISLYNHQYGTATNNPDIHQFACVGINADGSSMSVTPHYCKMNQSSTTLPVTHSNQDVGAVLSLTSTSDPCPPCPVLIAPTMGSVSIATNGAVTSAIYECNDNYTLSSNESRICQNDGTWSGTQPSCTCPVPSSPSNGDVTLSANGQTATFTCDPGYILDGVSVHTCDTVTNLWSHTQPVCNKCVELTAPSNGSIQILFTGETSVVYYTCNVGSTLYGDGTRTCQQDTTWTTSAPTCTSCPTLTSIDSGNVTLTTSGTITTATFTCYDGYNLSGNNQSVCDTSGQWDPNTLPACECIPPEEPYNGTYIITGSQVEYTCYIGYTIDGPSVRHCNTDGTGWTSIDPTCTLCQPFSAPTNGIGTTSTNGTVTIVTYTCDVGFTMNGDSISSCQTDGTWTTNSPTCTECNTLPNVNSGSFVYITDGTTTSVEYTCDVGATISGDVIVSCDVNGEWSMTSVSCVSCPDIPDVSGGSFTLQSNGTSTSAELTCQTGYAIQGETTIECHNNGTWSSSQPDCVKIGGSTGSETDTPDLLPAVIALAVGITLLGVALAASCIYIWKLKKSSIATIKKENTEQMANGAFPVAQRPPIYHGNSIMDNWNTFPNSSAPVSHNNTPRPDSAVSTHPVSMKSVVSAGSLNVDLVRETTISSVYNDQPAPWSKTPKRDTIGDSSASAGPLPPLKEHALLTKAKKEQTNITSPRKKKMSYGKKMQRQNSMNNIVNGHKDDKTHPAAKASDDASPVDDMARKHKSVLVSRAGAAASTKLKLETLTSNGRPVRATTPIKHKLEVNDTDIIGTPRSNPFTTIQ